MSNVLIVGAGGFIGGFIAAESLRRGFRTTAAIRTTTSRRYLTDERLQLLELDYDDPKKLGRQLKESAPEGGWDYVIYNLGATKCVNFRDFNLINHQYLRNFVTALADEGLTPRKFLYMSSLSAVGAGDERGYTPLKETDMPHPNTRYGLSKIKSEQWLQTAQAGFPWIIFRPTGVYGPHEQDYLMMIKSIDRHLDVGVGYRKQMLTFIYVEDLVEAMFMALERAPLHRIYNISEPRAYTQAEFRQTVGRHLGRKGILSLRLPLWAVKAGCTIAEKWGALSGKASTLNRDKYNILKQRNWLCSTEAAREDFGFTAATSLDEGIKKTVEAYRKSLARDAKTN